MATGNCSSSNHRTMSSTRISENGADEEDDFKSLGLPADLEAKTYAKFDSMVNERRIFYEVTKAEIYSHNGFLVGFLYFSLVIYTFSFRLLQSGEDCSYPISHLGFLSVEIN